MSSYRKFIRNNYFVSISHLLLTLKGLILIPVIIKTVGETVFGGYTLVNSIVGIFFGLSPLGVGFNFSRYMPAAEERETRRMLFYPQFSFQFISIFVLSLVLLWSYPLLANIFIKGDVNFSPWLIAPYLFFYFLYSQGTSYFRYTHRVNYFNYSTIAYPYIHIGLIFLVYYLFEELSVDLIFASMIISSIIVAIPLCWGIVQEIGFKFVLPDGSNLMKDMKLGYPLVIAYIVDVALGSSDRFIIAALLSVTSVGYYAPAYALGSLILFFPKVSGVVLPPLISKSVDEGNSGQAQTMVNYTIKIFLLLAIPFVFGSAALSKQLLTLFANEEVARQANFVTPIIALGMLFYGLNLILSNVLFVKLKTKDLLKINIYTVVMNIVLNICLLYAFKNILFAAISSLFSYLFVFVFIMIHLSKEWPVRFSALMITKSIIASLIMYAVLLTSSTVLNSDLSKMWQPLVQVCIGVLLYSFVLLAMRPFTAVEINYLKKTFMPSSP